VGTTCVLLRLIYHGFNGKDWLGTRAKKVSMWVIALTWAMDDPLIFACLANFFNGRRVEIWITVSRVNLTAFCGKTK
jgi:hypothetical protein